MLDPENAFSVAWYEETAKAGDTKAYRNMVVSGDGGVAAVFQSIWSLSRHARILVTGEDGREYVYLVDTVEMVGENPGPAKLQEIVGPTKQPRLTMLTGGSASRVIVRANLVGGTDAPDTTPTVRPERSTPTPVPTRVKTSRPRPTMAPTVVVDVEMSRSQYRPIDVRDLMMRSGSFKGEKIVVSGSVFTIFADEKSSQIQLWVTAPDGSQEAVIIYCEGNTEGIYEGTWLTVYGTAAGTFTFTNALGGQVTQPLIMADLIEQ